MMRRLIVTAGIACAAALITAPGWPALAMAHPHPDVAAVQVSADPYLNHAAQHATEVEPARSRQATP